ncbi:MAG: redoxin family protein [Clostridia bacterium]|nr:redoxin family protein [Clostridia bacterium]
MAEKRFLLPKRRLIQLYAALLYNAHAKGFIKGEIYTGPVKAVCVPGLNCYSCPGAVSACPLGSLQNALASSGKRAPYYAIGILLLFGIILGRTVCGYLCPIGLFQELLHKIPVPKLKKSRFTRALSGLKYGILIILVILIPLWMGFKDYPLPAFCKYICPAGTLQGAVGLLAHPANTGLYPMLGALFASKMTILILLALVCMFVYRAFCRFLCPLGAIYGLFARFAVIGVKVDRSACVHCGKCLRKCEMDIRHVGDHECIQCGECIDVCPVNAISLKAGKITLREKASEKKKNAFLWPVLVCILLILFIFVNWPDKKTEEPIVPLETGYEIGMRAPAFTVPCYDGAAYDSQAALGKVQVINFWATWCGPCVKELPYFEEIRQKYGDHVSIAAIHSSLVTEDVAAYVASLPYAFDFALDETGSVITSFGGSTLLPHTVVLDQNGTVIYNQTGSVTYEQLEAIILPCLEAKR